MICMLQIFLSCAEFVTFVEGIAKECSQFGALLFGGAHVENPLVGIIDVAFLYGGAGLSCVGTYREPWPREQIVQILLRSVQ